MLHFIYSAPADASTEDGAAHATGNGVASEVGSVHAHSHSLCCDLCHAFLSVLFLFMCLLSSQFSFLLQLFSVPLRNAHVSSLFFFPVCQATGDGEGAGAEDVDSDSDSDDDDDDVRVTIGDIKTGAPQYT